MPNPPGLLANIRAEAARRGKTQADIAKALGISNSGITDRLKGRTQISVDELVLIADLFGLPAAALLETPAPAEASA